MVDVTFKPSELKLTIKGHANAAEKGKDIVCSAVSILAYQLAYAVEESRDMLEEEPVIQIEEGDVLVSCVPKKPFLATMQRTYWTVLCGFELLVSMHGNYITFTVE